MKYSLWMVVALNRYKALKFQQQFLKIFQSEFPLSVFKSLPIFDQTLQKIEWW